MKRPAYWIETNNKELNSNLGNFSNYEELKKNFQGKDEEMVGAFCKYNKSYHGMIPTIIINSKIKYSDDFSEFKDLIYNRNLDASSVFIDMKYSQEPKTIMISGIESVYAVMTYTVETKSGVKYKLRSHKFSIPCKGFYIQMNCIDDPFKEDCKAEYTELAKTIKIDDKFKIKEIKVEMESCKSSKDTVKINEPFRITYVLVGKYSQGYKISEKDKAREKDSSSYSKFISAFHVKSVKNITHIKTKEIGYSIETKDENTKIGMVVSSSTVGKCNLPDLIYTKNEREYRLKGGSVFVLNERISAADSVVAWNNSKESEFHRKFQKELEEFNQEFKSNTESKIDLDPDKTEFRAVEKVIRVKAGQEFVISYQNNCSDLIHSYQRFESSETTEYLGSQTSISSEIVNGKKITVQSVKYKFKVLKPETITLAPISIICNGETLNSEEITIIVN